MNLSKQEFAGAAVVSTPQGKASTFAVKIGEIIESELVAISFPALKSTLDINIQESMNH